MTSPSIGQSRYEHKRALGIDATRYDGSRATASNDHYAT